MCDTTHITMVIHRNRNAARAVKYSRKHDLYCLVELVLLYEFLWLHRLVRV